LGTEVGMSLRWNQSRIKCIDGGVKLKAIVYGLKSLLANKEEPLRYMHINVGEGNHID
jgi:hypothetical protein